MSEKPCGHPPHPEDGNFGIIPIGSPIKYLNRELAETHRDDPKWYVGRHCKLGFPVKDDPRGRKEYMWVEVIGIEEKELLGKLSNTPVLPSDFASGGLIAFDTSEILDVLEGT